MRTLCVGALLIWTACSVYTPTEECFGDACADVGACGEDAGCSDVSGVDAAPPDGLGATPACVSTDTCVTPRIQTLPPTSATASSLVVRARLREPGNLDITAAGACAAPTPEVSPEGDASTCVSVALDVLLGEGAVIDGLQGGTRHYAAAWLETALGPVVGETVDAYTLPAAPAGLAASDGESSESVSLRWEPVVGATRYVVYRDGAELGMTETTEFVDSSAEPGGMPLAPLLAASQGTSSGYVRLSWPPVEITPGTAHAYGVVAVGPGGESERAEDTGFRAGPPIEFYEWRMLPDGEWTRAYRREVLDSFGPLCESIPLQTTVSHGTVYGEIVVEAEPLEVPEMPRVSYEVRATNVYGTGPVSEPAVGWKAFGGILLDLEWGPAEITVGGGVFATTKVSGGPSLEQRWAPDLLGHAFCMRYVTRSANCERSASDMSLGWAAECDGEHPCADGKECLYGVCVTEGFSPAFATLAWKGSVIAEFGRSASEQRHRAMLTRNYEWSRTEVTQGEWLDLMGANPSYFADCGLDCPVENISRYAAMAYANAFSTSLGYEPCYVFGDDCTGSAAEGTLVCPSRPGASSESGNVLDCEGFRLPIETEWEFAAKFDDAEITSVEGGFRVPGCEGDENAMTKAWYCANAEVSDRTCIAALQNPALCVATHPVATVEPNRFGVYDIYGNVSEWAWDGGGEYWVPSDRLYTTDAITGGSGAITRGGWFGTDMFSLRAAARYGRPHDYRGPEVGLRLVRTR